MRHLSLQCVVLLLLLPFVGQGQETYWGLTSRGGVNNAGTIYTMTSTGTYTKRYDFQLNGGQAIRSDLTKATDGKYYGVTAYGGDAGLGTLFRFDPATNVYSVLVYFSTTTGSYPDRGVIQASNGKLYGVCRNGGVNAFGTLYEYDLTTSTFTKRVDFAGGNGNTPRGRLVQAPNGKLYGATQVGGSGSVGTIFEFDPATNTYAKRFNMVAATGTGPASGMIVGADGLLYGTTQTGGANSVGVIYSFNTTTFAMLKLADMSSTVGSTPVSELVQASDGLLYGTASVGGTNNYGTIFKYNIAVPALTKLFNMASATGTVPLGRMMQASDGLLYGTTSTGGTSDKGVIYSFDPISNVFSVVRMMGAANAANPYAGLTEDPAGTFLGTASAGGSSNIGVIFKYVLASSTYTELVSIGYSNGAYPWGSMARASNGLFYGLTSAGGSANAGVLFSFNPNSNTFTPLVDMSSARGTYPVGRPVVVGNVIYGLCRQGGTSGEGTLFAYDIGSNTYTVQVNLATATGTRPQAGMLLASNGKLYGSAAEGGSGGYGTLFSYVPGATALSVIRNLLPADGSAPLADPIQAADGMLYGTLSELGGFGGGAIYRIDPSTDVFTRVGNLETEKGTLPSGELVESSPGKLYGTCSENGANLFGTIFSFTVATSTVTKELDFTSAQASNSEGGLIKGNDNLLYGTAVGGGTNQFGTIFRWNPTANTLAVLRSLSTADGIYPHDGMVKETIPASANILVRVKVLLDGPLNASTGRMTAALRSLASFPLTEPYTGLGFTQVGGGGETVAPAVLAVTGDNAIVDWVLLELRSKTNASTVVRTRCALLQSDGDVVDVDGTSAVSFPMPGDNYFIAVRPRNHLPVATLAVVALSSTASTVDLTTSALSTYGTNARKVNGAYLSLWAGDVVRDGVVKYTGSSNDRDPILTRIGGSIPTNTVTGYWPEDVNMDGVVKYTGASNDRDPVLTTIGATVPTASLNQQLP